MKYYLYYKQYTLVCSLLAHKTNSGLDLLTDCSQHSVWKTKLALIPQFFPFSSLYPSTPRQTSLVKIEELTLITPSSLFYIPMFNTGAPPLTLHTDWGFKHKGPPVSIPFLFCRWESVPFFIGALQIVIAEGTFFSPSKWHFSRCQETFLILDAFQHTFYN